MKAGGNEVADRLSPPDLISADAIPAVQPDSFTSMFRFLEPLQANVNSELAAIVDEMSLTPYTLH